MPQSNKYNTLYLFIFTNEFFSIKRIAQKRIIFVGLWCKKI